MRTVTELSLFREFLDERIAARDPITPEQAVAIWRDAMPPGDGLSDAEAIREAVADLEAGDRGLPAGEHLAEIRARIEAACEP